MSVKSDITALLKDGADYDRIQTETGAKRAYIRTIAAGWRKTEKTSNEETENDDAKTETKDNDNVLTIVNDAEVKMTDNDNNNKTKTKTGLQYHYEWVNAKTFECNCGCVLNRKSTYCPHCGAVLDWSGF